MRTAQQAVETTEANRLSSAVAVSAAIRDGKHGRAVTAILDEVDHAIGKTSRRMHILQIGKKADRAIADEAYDLLGRLGYGVGMSCSTTWENETWTITW